jgi:hypothetical protein
MALWDNKYDVIKLTMSTKSEIPRKKPITMFSGTSKGFDFCRSVLELYVSLFPRWEIRRNF